MRRSTRTALTTVSLAALLSLTSVQSFAVQPAIQILGVLKAKDNWQVGSVETQGAEYCAMISHFDQASVLAFARNADGYGSLAIEFQDKMFNQGKNYEIQLSVDTGMPRTFSGKATNPRALVIQIGQDDALYNSFATSKTLRFTSEAIDAKFALNKFEQNYKKLVSCSIELAGPQEGVPQMAAVKVEDVEAVEVGKNTTAKAQPVIAAAKTEQVATKQMPAAPAADMTETKATEQVADATAEKKSLFAPIGGFFQKLAGKSDAAVSGAEKKSETVAATASGAATTEIVQPVKVAAADTAKADVTAKAVSAKTVAAKTVDADAIVWSEEKTADLKNEISDKKKEIAKIETEKKVVERKLLAGMGSSSVSALPEQKGLTAREMEQQQTATLQKAIHSKENEIAVLAAVREQAARKEQDSTEQKMLVLSRNAGEMKLQEESLASAEKASSAMTTAATAGAAASVAAVAAKTPGQKELAMPAAEKVEMVDAKAAEAKKFADNAHLATVKAQHDALAKLEADKARENTLLAQKLDNIEAEFSNQTAKLEAERDGLKRQLAQALAFNETVAPKAEAEILSAQKKVNDLSQKLNTAEADRQEMSTRLAQLEKQKADLEGNLISKEEALVMSGQEADKLATSKTAMTKLQTELAAKAEQAAALQAQLDAEKAKVLAATQADSKLGDQYATLSANLTEKQAEADKLEARMIEMEKTRVAEAEKAMRLQQERDDARKQVESLKASMAEKTAAIAVVPDVAMANNAALMEAEDEISALKEQKAMLEQKLATAAARPVPQKVAVQKPMQDIELIPGTDMAMTLSKIAPAAGTPTVEVFEAPIGSYTPVAPAQQPLQRPMMQPQKANKASGGINNAESFLNSIMKHHVPAGSPAPKASAVTIPTVPSIARPVQPVMQKPVLMPVQKSSVGSKSGMSPVSLETLLEQSGVRGAVFQPAEAGKNGAMVRQWNMGSISGLYEQMPAQGNINAMTSAYVARYQEDCPNDLNISMGNPTETNAGTAMVGAMACSMPGNSYNTSMVFVQSGKKFSAVLHSGQPFEAAQVKSLGDNLMYAVSASGGIATPSMAMQQPSAPMMQKSAAREVPQAAPQMRFDMGQAAPAARTENDFETVVIQ